MTTKFIIEVSENEKNPLVVIEHFTGQKQNRIANMVMPGQRKEFVVHSNLNVQIMGVVK